MVRTDKIKEIGVKPIVLWLVSIAFFMQMLDGTVLNVALPSIALSIGEDPLQIQFIIVVYILTVAFFIPVSGWLADYFGTRGIFLSALVLFSLGSLFCAISTTFTQLVVSRIFQGVGGALLVPVGRLIVFKLFPQDKLVSALSFVTIPALIAPLIGPSVGGIIVEYWSWHWIFLINIPIGIIGFALSWKYMPDTKEEGVSSFDYVGFILFACAFLMFSLVLDTKSQVLQDNIQKLYAFILSVLLWLGYYLYAKRVKNPLFNKKLFTFRNFNVGILGNLFARIAGGSMPLLTPLFAQLCLGISPSVVGFLMISIGAMSIVGKMLIEPLVRFFGLRKLLIFNTLLLGLSVMAFGFVGTDVSFYSLIFLLSVFGVLNSLQFTAMMTATMIDLSRKYSSQGNSLLSVVAQLAVSTGISLSSMFLGYFSSDIDRANASELIKPFHYTYFLIGFIICVTSMIFVMLSNDIGQKKSPVRLPVEM